MSAGRMLVAGIGNIFFGDDGFGVAVAQALGKRRLPAGVIVKDFGIRGIDLTYALLEAYETVIFVDAMKRGGKAGSLHLIEPDLESLPDDALTTHEMTPAKVLAAARSMGATFGRVLVLGCEPQDFGSELDPRMGLTPPVAAAVEKAVALLETLCAQQLESQRA